MKHGLFIFSAIAAQMSFGAVTNEVFVAEGETKTLTDLMSGITVAKGDWIKKTGPGTLTADNFSQNNSLNYIIAEGVFSVPSTESIVKGNSSNRPTLRVLSGASVNLAAGVANTFSGNWNVYLSGNGTGEGDNLGALCVGGSLANPSFGTGSNFILEDDATIYSYGTVNSVFSGASETAGSTLKMNNYTLIIRGKDENAVFRPRWKWTINNAGPIVIKNGVFTRHLTTNAFSPNIPLISFTDGATMDTFGDNSIWSYVDAFAFDYGTTIKKVKATTSASLTMKKLTGPVDVSNDMTLTISQELVARGGDLQNGHYLQSANALTLSSGCALSVEDVGVLDLSDGKTYTIAKSDVGITGTPELTGDAANLFTVANTGTEVVITSKGGFVGGFLPGVENAAANTAHLATLATVLSDNATIQFPGGDIYFTDAVMDFSAFTAKNISVMSLGKVARLHATIKAGAQEGFRIYGIVFKDVPGVAVEATGTAGLVIQDCTLDHVIGEYGVEGKKYPYAFVNVTGLEVTGVEQVFSDFLWDDMAYFSGGTQTSSSEVADGVWVVNSGWLGSYVHFGTLTNRLGYAASAYNGKSIRKVDSNTFGADRNLATLGITNVEVWQGSYSAALNTSLGTAGSGVVISNGANVTIVDKIDNRRITLGGEGVSVEYPAMRISGNSAWDKIQYITFALTDDATIYDNVGNEGNGSFLYCAFEMNGHRLRLTGKNFRFGRTCNWKGGGTLEVDGATVGASSALQTPTETPNRTNYAIADGVPAKMVVTNAGKVILDTPELLYMFADVDFATPDCELGFRNPLNSQKYREYEFATLAGAPIVSNNVASILVATGYKVHAADMKADKKIEMSGAMTFSANTSVEIDDLTQFEKVVRHDIVTAEGGITGKPKVTDAMREAGWACYLSSDGKTLYLDKPHGMAIIVR